MSATLIAMADLAALLTGGEPSPAQYLATYEPEAHDGLGYATWTTDPAAAMTFIDLRAAYDTWTAVPANRPWRDDGQPNKPLTAHSVTFIAATDVPR